MGICIRRRRGISRNRTTGIHIIDALQGQSDKGDQRVYQDKNSADVFDMRNKALQRLAADNPIACAAIFEHITENVRTCVLTNIAIVNRVCEAGGSRDIRIVTNVTVNELHVGYRQRLRVDTNQTRTWREGKTGIRKNRDARTTRRRASASTQYRQWHRSRAGKHTDTASV